MCLSINFRLAFPCVTSKEHFDLPVHVIPFPSNPPLHMHSGVPVKFLQSALTSHWGSQIYKGSSPGKQILKFELVSFENIILQQKERQTVLKL